ncbi:MAG: hypothetical protein IT172_05205 [Acidobacteria bacterium]|nr:hypothetical protein [Acidobacteriota bacterium]
MTKLRLTTINLLKSLIILAVLAGFSGCRELSVFFDPGKGAPKKQLKVVKRDKPNLESDPGEREVDPNAADLVEATEEEAAEDAKLAQAIVSEADLESADENELIAEIERKAKAIVGRWETTTGTDDYVAIEFGMPKAEGDTFAGTYTFFVSDTKEEPAKYVVSRDEAIQFFTSGGEISSLKITVSPDGQSVTYFGNKGLTSKMVRAGSGPKQTPVPAKTPNIPKEDVPRQKATPYRPEIHDQ